MANSVRLAIALLTVVLSRIGGDAQIMDSREVGDKTIMCMHSGLMSDLNDCGVRSDWYADVFVGSIAAKQPTSNGEQILQVTPEELFNGNPRLPLTVLTSQGACLPTLTVGIAPRYRSNGCIKVPPNVLTSCLGRNYRGLNF